MGENTRLWELLTEANPDRNSVPMQDRQIYKQILIQSNAHRVIVLPVRSKRAKVLNIDGLFHHRFQTQKKFLGNRYNNNVAEKYFL